MMFCRSPRSVSGPFYFFSLFAFVVSSLVGWWSSVTCIERVSRRTSAARLVSGGRRILLSAFNGRLFYQLSVEIFHRANRDSLLDCIVHHSENLLMVTAEPTYWEESPWCVFLDVRVCITSHL